MGLTESKVKDLEDRAFDTLYKKHKNDWLSDAKDAYDYAKKHITGDREPRPDDILKGLLPVIEVNEYLRKHQATNKARNKRYREYFGEYIVDKYLQSKGEKT